MFLCTCKADLLKAQQAEDAVVELELSAMALVHLVQDAHQLHAGFGWVGTLCLMSAELMERPVPRAANPLVLALCHSISNRNN